MGHSKVALVTGANGGFGTLITKTLAEAGHRVYASMRGTTGKNAAAAEALRGWANERGLAVTPLELDVTDEDSIHRAVGQLMRAENRLDVVVNNAGVGTGGPEEAFTADQLQAVFDINVFGVHRVNRAVLPTMRRQGEGLLINVSSLLGRVTMPFLGPYNASKYALEGLIESLRPELEPFGVDAVIVEPGGYPTAFGSNSMIAADTARLESYGPVAEIPGKVFAGMMKMYETVKPDPQDVADAVAALVSTPRGERPLRTVVTAHNREAVEAINRVSNEQGGQLAEGMGVTALLAEAKSQLKH